MIAASASPVRAAGATARPIAAGRTRRPVALASAPPASAPTRSAMTTTRTAARETPAVAAGADARGIGAVWSGGGVSGTGIAENILIVEITVRLRAAQERAGAEAAEAQKARTEASFALQMREELLTFWSQRLRGPFGDLSSRLARVRHAVESNDRAGTISALDDLAKDVTAVQRTAEHWIDQRQKTS